MRSIAGRVRRAKALFLFLDYDGTIVPLRKTPGQAVLSARGRRLLRRLRQLPGTTVGVVTGRSLEDIRKLLGPGNIVLAANHGFEIVNGSRTWTHPEALRLRSRLAGLSTALRRRLRHIPRVHLENTRFTLSVHYRNVPRTRVDDVRKTVLAVIRSSGLPVRTTDGKKVIEVRPAAVWDKGHALRRILRSLGYSRNHLVIYCGDDVTDEDAFRLLPHSAVTLRVGPSRSTNARFYVRKVSEVYRFLTRLQMWRGGKDQAE